MRSTNADRPGRRHRISGAVNADGTIQKGSGFTVQKGATGTYNIRFNNSQSIVGFVAGIIGGATGFCNVSIAVGIPALTIVIQNYTASVNVDSQFMFDAECIAV